MTPEGMQDLAVVFRVSAAGLDERQQLVEAAQDPDVQTADDFTGDAAATYQALCERAGMTGS